MAKILIIDDDTDTIKLLEGMIQMNGHQPVSVNNSMTAVEVANTSMPDLIFLDIMMPGINGIELCRIFQATPTLKHIPIIILSALNDEGSKRDARNAGARIFLTKPIQYKELVNQINSLLNQG